MAELTFPVSPGVVMREIDLTGPTQVSPTGVPAGVVGTAVRGPAFVPVTVATFQDFVSVFGNSDGEKFGPIAMREWLRNAGSGTYLRVLGVGDGKPRTTSGNNTGKVTNAGFVVGQPLVQPNGNIGKNAYAGSTSVNPGVLGRTHFLIAYMSESAGSTVLSDAGIQTQAQAGKAAPVIRGVLLAPSGVVLGLSSSLEANNAPASDSAAYSTWGAGANAGSPIGTVNLSNGKQEFVLLVNGLKTGGQFSNVLTASFDTKAPNYFANVLNSDPTKIEAAGHYLYANFDISTNLAVVTGSGICSNASPNGDAWSNSYGGEPIAMLLTSSLDRNTGNSTTSTAVGVPNFENFETRYEAAFTPWIVSQKFGDANSNLFKFHTLSDGAIGSGEFKITIENVAASSKPGNRYGTFDVLVRRFLDNDLNPQVVESFRGCTLDPSSDSYVAKRIGDRHTYFDFDAPVGSKKLIVEGDYPNVSNYVRIELSDELKNGMLDATALPVGFRGLHHLATAASSPNGVNSILTGSFSSNTFAVQAGISTNTIKLSRQLPVPMRESISTGVVPKKTVQSAFTWGVQFEYKDSITEPNSNEQIDSSLLSFAKYFPRFHATWQNPWVGDNAGAPTIGTVPLDSDLFNNNLFTLERVQVITGSDDRPDPQQWAAATYRRSGVAASSLSDRDGTTSTKVRFLDMSKDFAHVPTQKYLKFTLPMIGGFDGLNIFDSEKSKMTDVAARREMTDTSQAGKLDSTVAAYRAAVDIMEAKQDVDIQLLAIPGIRHPAVVNYAIEATERRFDALYLMDVEEMDEVNSYVTGSLQSPNVVNTVGNFAGRALDTSFAAAYFPDVVITDPATRTNVKVPPSAMVLGAMAYNDAVAYPWFAPAGFTRGALPSGLYPAVDLLQTNRDALYTVDINPIIGDVTSTGGVTVYGQKTLLAAQSALDRVNVRRLLIDIRRKVRAVARTFLFEPNQASTIAAFNARVAPILAAVQSQGGLDRYKVKIDASTTTQADVENNTIRGRIYLQPTRSIEFVSLDFVVSNSL